MVRCSVALIVLLAALSSVVTATTVVPLTFEQLVNESAAVVYGRVTDVRPQWSDDRRFIESVVSIEILRGLKGATRQTMAFTVPGGQVGRYVNVIPGAPAFSPGDLAVFFLSSRGARLPVTTGLTQGIYRVQHDARSGAMLVMPPVIEPGRIVRGDAGRRPAPLAVFESSVRGIVGAR